MESKTRHASTSQLVNVINQNLVRGIPKLDFSEDNVCGPCQSKNKLKDSLKTRIW